MIPLQLTIKNFLSYRDATLNFRGLHTACICGANGAGKSSLLEAITWVIWGKSRAATDDDVIYRGAKNVRVDFEFICNSQTYRIIRSRPRGKSGSLEFQIATSSGNFRSITAKGVRATQDEIVACLKLDYDTFTNSAYLRQGRSNEFMLRRPNERKQILADLLKLERYEQLSSQAKDLAREYKGKIEQLKQNLEPLESELGKQPEFAAELTKIQQQLTHLQEIQNSDRDRLQQLQAIDYQRQNWEKQLSLQQTQYQNLVADCDRATQDIASLQSQLTVVEQLLERESEIVAGYERLLEWQAVEKDLSTKFEADCKFQQQKQQLEKQLIQHKNELNLKISQIQTRWESIEQQEREIKKTISRTGDIESAVARLTERRQQLQALDKIQQYVSPLILRKHNLQTQIETEKARLAAKLEQLYTAAKQLASDIERVPEKRTELLTVDAQIEELDKKRIYQKRVEEKGNERKEFRLKLQENQRLYEQQWQELQQKLQMLSIPEAICPLCERELNEHHRDRVVGKTQQQQQEIQEQIWVIREQLSTCERELQLLRQEYKEISAQISVYDSLKQQLGQLEAQLDASEASYEKLRVAQAQKEHLELSLNSGNYAEELQSEIQQVEAEIIKLNYDDKTHALLRGEVDDLRWAEIKQAKIEDAKKRQQKLEEQKPQLLAEINSLQTALEKLHIDSDIQRKIHDIEREIFELG
jgi:DNA repair protein SbcC/Rad50